MVLAFFVFFSVRRHQPLWETGAQWNNLEVHTLWKELAVYLKTDTAKVPVYAVFPGLSNLPYIQ